MTTQSGGQASTHHGVRVHVVRDLSAVQAVCCLLLGPLSGEPRGFLSPARIGLGGELLLLRGQRHFFATT